MLELLSWSNERDNFSAIPEQSWGCFSCYENLLTFKGFTRYLRFKNRIQTIRFWILLNAYRLEQMFVSFGKFYDLDNNSWYKFQSIIKVQLWISSTLFPDENWIAKLINLAQIKCYHFKQIDLCFTELILSLICALLSQI